MTENQHEPDQGTTTEDRGPRVDWADVRDLSRLRRSTDDRHVAGVAGGLGRHLDIDPLILRVAFVVLAFFGGAGVVLYVACWLLVPEDTSDRATVDVDPRSRTVALLAVGVLALLLTLGDWGGWVWFPWPLLVLALIAWLVFSRRQPRRPEDASGATSAAADGTAYDDTWMPRPRHPRRRGPVLFWFTLALTALALGVLGTVDLAGAPVADPAYPALALGIIAAMLLVGAFWGRAGGLILLGLVALVALVGSTAADHTEGRRVVEQPTAAMLVEDTYELHTGELVVDLTEVDALQVLDGRELELSVGVGRLHVILPEHLSIDVEGSAGVGSVRLFESEEGGLGVSDRAVHSSGSGDRAHLTIDATVGVGEIRVEKDNDPEEER